MKLVIVTQFRENYGAHAWDGEGECPQYWKNKGGYTYVVEDLDWLAIDDNKALAEKVCAAVSHSDEYSDEFVLNWSFEEDDEPVDYSWCNATRIEVLEYGYATVDGREPFGWSNLFKWVEEKRLRDADFKSIEGSYVVFYHGRDGRIYNEKDAMEMVKAQEAA